MAKVDYAPLAALEPTDDEDDLAVSIVDDIVFDDSDTGDATEKWQGKHTVTQTAPLSDAGDELWKTLGNGSRRAVTGERGSRC